MNKSSKPHTTNPISSHEFSEATPVYFDSSSGKANGWYFTDNDGVLFGPVGDETRARKILADLSMWFNNKGTTATDS
jgi:hypothetical protein